MKKAYLPEAQNDAQPRGRSTPRNEGGNGGCGSKIRGIAHLTADFHNHTEGFKTRGKLPYIRLFFHNHTKFSNRTGHVLSRSVFCFILIC